MKKFAIIMLVALCVIGWVMFASSKVSESNTQKNYVKDAEMYFEKGLYQRAIMSYELAIDEDASEKLYEKIVESYELRYKEAPEATLDDFIAILEEANSLYPKNTTFIDGLVKLYHIDSDYESMYKCLVDAIKNGYDNDEIQKKLREAKYSFKIKGSEYGGILFSTGDYYSVKRGKFWNLYTNEDGYIWEDEYDFVTRPNSDGIAVVVGKDSRIINSEGVVLGIFKKQISDAGLFSDDLIPVCVDGVYGYYNDMAEYQFGKYEYAGIFQDGKAAVKQNGKWHIINAKGEAVSENYSEIVLDYTGRYLIDDKVLVKINNNSYAICDEDLKQLSSFKANNVDILTEDGLIAFCQNDKWGFIDCDGEIVVKATYDNAKSFSNGVAAVCKDGLWGFIDQMNNLVIDYQFTDVCYMDSNGICVVRTDEIYEETTTEVSTEVETTNNVSTTQVTVAEIDDTTTVNTTVNSTVNTTSDTTVSTTTTATTVEGDEAEDEDVKLVKSESWQFLELNLGITKE